MATQRFVSSWLLLVLQLPLGVTAALSDVGTAVLVGTAVVAGTFVVVFSVLYFATTLLCTNKPGSLIRTTTSAERKDGGTITDKDSDSTRSDEEEPTGAASGSATQSVNEGSESSSFARPIWRIASERMKALNAPQPRDEETGNTARPLTPKPAAEPVEPLPAISASITKLLSENHKPSFSAMAEAFVRNAGMGEDSLPRDDDLWSGYSGGSRSQLSVFDDSSCDTQQTMELMQRSSNTDLSDANHLLPADVSEEAWLEFLEGAVVRQEREGNSKSSLNISKELMRPDILRCTLEL